MTPEIFGIVVVPVTFRLEKVGVSVNVIVAPTPDAVAVKLEPTKLIFLTLLAVPTRDPSSLIVTPTSAI